MRATYIESTHFSSDSGDIVIEMNGTHRNNISFTGNAIQYLTTRQNTINLKEWVWHEEIINGVKHYIITDKLLMINSY